MIVQRRTPKRIRVPRGEGIPRPDHVRTREACRRLREWARRAEKLPSLNKALAGKYISCFERHTRPDRL